MAHTKPDTPPPMIATDGPVGMDIIWKKKKTMYMYQMTMYTGLHGGGWKPVLTPSPKSHLINWATVGGKNMFVHPSPRFGSQYGMTQEIQYQNT